MPAVQVGVQVCRIGGAQAVDVHVNFFNVNAAQVVLQPCIILGYKIGVGVGLEHKQVIAVAASDAEVAVHIAVNGHHIVACAKIDAAVPSGNIPEDIHTPIASAHYDLVCAASDIAVQREDVVAIAHIEGICSTAQIAVDFDVVVAAAGIDDVGRIVTAAYITRKRDAVAMYIPGLTAALDDVGSILIAKHCVGLARCSGFGRDHYRNGTVGIFNNIFDRAVPVFMSVHAVSPAAVAAAGVSGDVHVVDIGDLVDSTQPRSIHAKSARPRAVHVVSGKCLRACKGGVYIQSIIAAAAINNGLAACLRGKANGRCAVVGESIEVNNVVSGPGIDVGCTVVGGKNARSPTGRAACDVQFVVTV